MTRLRPGTAERRLPHAAARGALVDLSTGDARQDDPVHGATWGPERTVRAGALAELLTRAADGGRLRAVKVRGARITGDLDLEAAEPACPLVLTHCHIERPVNLSGAVLSSIRLSGCHLPGLVADQLRTTADLSLDGVTVEGAVTLRAARIGGSLDLSGARLANPDGVALQADSMTVAHCVFCRAGFAAEGQVRMLSARIGEAFSLEGATLDHPDGDALYAVRLTVDGDLFFRRGLTVRGNLQLSGARVGGLIDLSGALLSHPGRQVLDLYTARAAELHLLPRRPPDGIVNLGNTQVGVFEDDESTWPPTVLLRGFTYATLQNDRADVRARLRWLTRDPGGYVPQIYDQLAAAYRRAGREEAARRVMIAKQWRRRGAQAPMGKLANWLLYLTVGYGYRTWLAAVWLAGLLALGTAVFSDAHPHQLTRADPHGPGFSALGYTLDTLLPIVDLGQQKAWQAHGAAMYWSWAFIAAGWVLTTAVVAGLTGILKRD